jgi:hypothetical protein
MRGNELDSRMRWRERDVQRARAVVQQRRRSS